jgi:hypothetical protein
MAEGPRVAFPRRNRTLHLPHPLAGVKPQRVVHSCGGASFEIAAVDAGGRAKIRFVLCKTCGKRMEVDDTGTVQNDASHVSVTETIG